MKGWRSLCSSWWQLGAQAKPSAEHCSPSITKHIIFVLSSLSRSELSIKMPRINVTGIDAAGRKQHPREFSLLHQLGGEAVDSDVSPLLCQPGYCSLYWRSATVLTSNPVPCRPWQRRQPPMEMRMQSTSLLVAEVRPACCLVVILVPPAA